MNSSSKQSGIRRLGVFCGSAEGNNPEFGAAASALGTLLSESGIGLVYGGARVGIMGIVADAVMSSGGEVIGVLPRGLEKREIAHDGLTELHVVDSMHERKALISDLSDAFVALPGGIGTLEEFFEAWTWGLLGIHQKPCGILNADGFYDRLLELISGIQDLSKIEAGRMDVDVKQFDVNTLMMPCRGGTAG